jgi:hypothetical protein
MNFNIIIHALIIIFILHVIIINLDYTITIGNKRNINQNVENMTNQKQTKNIEKNNESESLDFLLGNSKKNDAFQQKMNNYIKEIEVRKNETINFDTKNEFPVIAANSFLDNENTPNFESNVADTPKFYKINNNDDTSKFANSYDNLNENELKQTSLSTLKNNSNKSNNSNSNNSNIFNKVNNIEKDINIASNTVRQSQVNPDNWSYKNDFPMNGAPMNGIVGFDGLESQYADFGSFFKLETNTKQPIETLPHDDLRKPVVYSD